MPLEIYLQLITILSIFALQPFIKGHPLSFSPILLWLFSLREAAQSGPSVSLLFFIFAFFLLHLLLLLLEYFVAKYNSPKYKDMSYCDGIRC